jgi:hypothetical protein
MKKTPPIDDIYPMEYFIVVKGKIKIVRREAINLASLVFRKDLRT